MTEAVRWLDARERPETGDAWLGPRERRVQDGLRFEPRRVSWRAGRYVAKRLLLHALGLPVEAARRVEILAAADGAPEAFLDEAPLEPSLSISHRPPIAVAAIGAEAVGIDYEVVETREASFVRNFFTEAERAVIAAAGPEADRVQTVMWSAKEAALKVRRTGLRRDTRSVQVSLRSPPGERAQDDWRPLTIEDLEDPAPVHARWRPFADGVLVIAAGGPLRIERVR